MRFRDGLVAARGQIAFLVALILSSALILHLETRAPPGGDVQRDRAEAVRALSDDLTERLDREGAAAAPALVSATVAAWTARSIDRAEAEARVVRALGLLGTRTDADAAAARALAETVFPAAR